MTAQLIDGRALAERIRVSLGERIAALRDAARPPALDAVLVGSEDNAARQYAESQGRQCAELGIEFRLHVLPKGAGFEDIAGRVLLLNTDDSVTGIMVHLPLPEGVDAYRVQRLIAPQKDVEGVNPANIGNVLYGRSSLVPCTALAAMRMIESTGVELRGRRAVVVGAGNVVGKPLAVLLIQAEATVVSCNIHTPDLASLTRSGDVLVAAAGVPELITAEMIKPGAVVVDVGVNRISGEAGTTRTCGDVAFSAAAEVAGWLSPVPGGVGPVTVATLLSNVVDAAERGPSCG